MTRNDGLTYECTRMTKDEPGPGNLGDRVILLVEKILQMGPPVFHVVREV